MSLLWAGAAALALGACEDEPTQSAQDVSALPFAEGSREARAAAHFANQADDAALKRAGVSSGPTRKAIRAQRDGADALPGTEDDAPFASLAVLDAVAGVGPATLKKLSAYALARGFADERGFYGSVYFTTKQADRVLELVNTLSIEELDATTSIDSRALKNIGAARPIGSMTALAAVSRVKTSALRLLREAADRQLSDPICDATTRCAPGLFCTGGSTSIGRCVDTGVEGAGDPCDAEGVCAAGLVCGGRDEDFSGLCVPAWMRDEYVNEGAASIPDVGSTGMSVEVFGLATVPLDGEVTALIDHPRPQDLELTLENPAGTSVMVLPRGSSAIPAIIPVDVPGDEQANGLWTLTVTDTKAGQTGAITFFALQLTSRFD